LHGDDPAVTLPPAVQIVARYRLVLLTQGVVELTVLVCLLTIGWVAFEGFATGFGVVPALVAANGGTEGLLPPAARLRVPHMTPRR
jgi:hypothetical protein